MIQQQMNESLSPWNASLAFQETKQNSNSKRKSSIGKKRNFQINTFRASTANIVMKKVQRPPIRLQQRIQVFVSNTQNTHMNFRSQHFHKMHNKDIQIDLPYQTIQFKIKRMPYKKIRQPTVSHPKHTFQPNRISSYSNFVKQINQINKISLPTRSPQSLLNFHAIQEKISSGQYQNRKIKIRQQSYKAPKTQSKRRQNHNNPQQKVHILDRILCKFQ